MLPINSKSALGSRSQLAANGSNNRFLLALGNRFGKRRFSSKDVANQLGIDFLHTAKKLCRMAHAPYNLLSARKMPRPMGGYENIYSISAHGWGKITYLQGHTVQRKIPSSSPEEVWASYYLANGMGEEADLMETINFNEVAHQFPPLYPSTDEMGRVLCHLDPAGQVLVEGIKMYMNLPQRDYRKTWLQARHLQLRGLIPREINVGLFVLNAYQRGSSDSAIISTLLLRGGFKLRSEVIRLKCLILEKAAQGSSTSTPSPPCEHCGRLEELIELYKLYIQLLKDKNSSLSRLLDRCIEENQQLDNRVNSLRQHIAMISRCLGLVTDGLNEIKDPPITLLPVKEYINKSLAGIVLMNCNA